MQEYNLKWQAQLAAYGIALCMALLVVSPGSTLAEAAISVDCFSGGGGESQSASYRIQDTFAQGPIGPWAIGANSQALDGFWAVAGEEPECPSHFEWSENTGCTYPIVISSATWMGMELPISSEIGVFDGDLCVGAVCWEGDGVGLAAWCDDTQTPEVDGYVCGNPIVFKIWNYEEREFCFAEATFETGDGTFCDGPYAMVSLDALCCQDIELTSGWNCLSTYMDPQDPSMLTVWADLIDTGNLNIVKNECSGEFCVPGEPCSMEWDVLSGYMAHLNEAATLSVCGRPSPVYEPIPLIVGWNCISYLPRQPQDLSEALATCWDQIDLVKNNCTGEFCIPGVWCGMDMLNVGVGYMVHMQEACELTYPSRGRSGNGEQSEVAGMWRGNHFTGTENTGATYGVVIQSDGDRLEEGDEIGVFGRGLCVGSGVWQEGPSIGIAVWGDDVTTQEVDGCLVGDTLSFMVWDESTSEEWEPGVAYTVGDGRYGAGPYALVNLSDEAAFVTEPVLQVWVNRLLQSYPNPAGPGTTIQYELSAPGPVELTIVNVNGQRVRQLEGRAKNAGLHTVIWDGCDEAGNKLSSGIYFYRIETEHFRSVKRMVVLK